MQNGNNEVCQNSSGIRDPCFKHAAAMLSIVDRTCKPSVLTAATITLKCFLVQCTVWIIFVEIIKRKFKFILIFKSDLATNTARPLLSIGIRITVIQIHGCIAVIIQIAWLFRLQFKEFANRRICWGLGYGRRRWRHSNRRLHRRWIWNHDYFRRRRRRWRRRTLWCRRRRRRRRMLRRDWTPVPIAACWLIEPIFCFFLKHCVAFSWNMKKAISSQKIRQTRMVSRPRRSPRMHSRPGNVYRDVICSGDARSQQRFLFRNTPRKKKLKKTLPLRCWEYSASTRSPRFLWWIRQYYWRVLATSRTITI